jgi:leucyl aminopeptidase
MFKSIAVASKSASTSSILALGYFKGEGIDVRAAAKHVGKDGVAALTAALTRAEATGESGAIVEAFPAGYAGRVLLVGLGEKGSFETGSFRGVAAAIGRRIVVVKGTGLHVDLGAAVSANKLNAKACGQAFGEGLGLLGWVCDQFKGSGSKPEDRERRPLAASFENAGFQGGVETGLALAASTNLCRTLSQTPPNVATTGFIAETAKRVAKECGLSIKIWEGEALEKEKFTGLINVGKASENKPCLIRLEYNPFGKEVPSGKKGQPLVLVGKTMTYDTGGLSLKINNGMVGMKRDKDGGCAVLGAMHAIATVVKPKRRVVALLAVAENSISDEAYRPDDVITYRNGVTVEVTNTDAEGRLVLADALCWACEKEDPASIVDLATLTGGVVVALGSTYCGMFCEDDGLRGRIEAAAKESGERVWRLPMHSEYREMMKSPVADILNSNANRKAHPIQGAAFLSYFVKEGVPWCHLDIAGVHVSESNKGMWVDGPTGWGVRLLAAFVDAS